MIKLINTPDTFDSSRSKAFIGAAWLHVDSKGKQYLSCVINKGFTLEAKEGDNFILYPNPNKGDNANAPDYSISTNTKEYVAPSLDPVATHPVPQVA